jgi:D-aminopeptidase
LSVDHITVEIDEQKLDAIFADLDQCHLPGAAVGLAVRGRPVYRKAFGLANAELPTVLSPTMRMRIGSTTKHFTCLAYMLLCEEGRARVDDPVGQYLPELHSVTHKVTMRQLMGHTGGLRDPMEIYYRFSGWRHALESAELLAFYRDIDDVNAVPGTVWCYNNGGYLMLTSVIERIAGQPLELVLRERIFERVGMHDTLLRRFDTDFVPNSATLHMGSAPGGFDKSYMSVEMAGEGGMVSTVDDMLRWLAHMDAPVVGTAATWKAMKEPQILANGSATSYGLGLYLNRYRGVETIHHAGGVMGGNAQMLKVPAVGLDAVVLVNRHDVIGMLLVNKILDATLIGLEPIAQSDSAPFIEGIFSSPTTGRVVHLFAEEGRQFASIDGVPRPVSSYGRRILRPTGPAGAMLDLDLTLLGNPERPTAIGLRDCGTLDELTPVKPADNCGAGAIAGRYRSQATGTDAVISDTGEGPRLKTIGRYGSVVGDIQCLAEGIWWARETTGGSLGGVLSFARDCKSFSFSNFSTRHLLFHRCD